jgi:hypothetical protein
MKTNAFLCNHATNFMQQKSKEIVFFSQTVHFWDKLYEGPGLIFWIICFAFSACNFFRSLEIWGAGGR